MRSSACPVSRTSLTPVSTCAVDAEISPLISLAASAERCASARTSEATTAKPRPASPARAASTPAFSASRLVWNAISSITPMIWRSAGGFGDRGHRGDRPAHDERAALGVPVGRPGHVAGRVAPADARPTSATISLTDAATECSWLACASARRERSPAISSIAPTCERTPRAARPISSSAVSSRVSAPLRSDLQPSVAAAHLPTMRAVEIALSDAGEFGAQQVRPCAHCSASIRPARPAGLGARRSARAGPRLCASRLRCEAATARPRRAPSRN